MKQAFMQTALDLATDNAEGGPFGAIVVRNGEIVGRGWNQVIAHHDPTAHAEIQAIRQASEHLNTPHLEDCEIYTSCEPCPMCLGAIHWARIRSIYYAASRADADEIGFSDAEIYAETCKPMAQRQIPMEQAMKDEAREIMNDWLKHQDSKHY